MTFWEAIVLSFSRAALPSPWLWKDSCMPSYSSLPVYLVRTVLLFSWLWWTYSVPDYCRSSGDRLGAGMPMCPWGRYRPEWFLVSLDNFFCWKFMLLYIKGCYSNGVANTFSSFTPFSNSFFGDPMLCLMVGCNHLTLYLSESWRASPDTAITGSCQQTFFGICHSVWVCCLYVGCITRWGSLWMVFPQSLCFIRCLHINKNINQPECTEFPQTKPPTKEYTS